MYIIEAVFFIKIQIITCTSKPKIEQTCDNKHVDDVESDDRVDVNILNGWYKTPLQVATQVSKIRN